MGTTSDLRRALKKRFFSHAQQRGFTIDERRQPGATVFRRPIAASVHIFEVQWDKYGKPRFRIHFGTCPTKGLMVGAAVVLPDETLPGWCADAGTLQPPFRQDSSWLRRLLGQPALRDPDAVVDELLKVFTELERYWASGDVGPHIRRWGIR